MHFDQNAMLSELMVLLPSKAMKSMEEQYTWLLNACFSQRRLGKIDI